MAPRVQKHRAVLQVLQNAKPSLRKAIIQASDKDLVYSLCEIADNLLRGNIPLTDTQKSKLQRYRTHIRKLAQKGGTIKSKKALLTQRGGAFPLIPLLISTAASVLPLLFQK